MAFTYNPPKPQKYLYDPNSKSPFKISRSSIDLYCSCPKCFYLDKRLGIAQPPGYPFTLNSAVDYLLKKEFDILRKKQEAHPLMKKFSIDAIPFAHKDLNVWRENFKGITYLDPHTNLIIGGAIDDIWINKKTKELHIVDYKSTSKNGEVNLDADWQDSYKRQMEIYQWLFRKNGFQVADIGYFVYCNGITDTEKFDAKLEFEIKIIPYTGDTSWIELKLKEIKKTLESNNPPKASSDCDYCKYREAVNNIKSTESQTSDEKKSEEPFDKGKLF
jgi:CRISPR/Cas system-associated exonuclease Cas4 (RecB family)